MPLVRCLVGEQLLLEIAVLCILMALPAAASAQSGDLQKAEQLNAKVLELHQLGRFAEAIPFAQETLGIRKRVLGSRHPDTAVSLNNLATLYGAIGAYAQAKPLLEEALVIMKRVNGPRHLETALSINSLAVHYYKTGDYVRAKPLYEEALAIRKELLGPKHLQTVESLNNLGVLYTAIGAYAEALPLLEEALAIRKEVVGPRHPDTAQAFNNLALLYQATGAYAKAKPLYEEAITIQKQVLGPRHPDVASILNNLADLYQSIAAYDEALPVLEEALVITKEALGSRHPTTAMSLNSLAKLHQARGAYAQAQPLYEQALAITKEVLGPRHPDTATILNNLAELYRSIGAYATAQPLYEESLAIRKAVLGPRHPDTAQALNNLALLYQTTGAYATAQPLYEDALAIQKAVLGPRHPDTASSLNNLGLLYRTTGAYAKAKLLYQEALAIRKAILGPRHQDTALSLNNLAELYQKIGAFAEAKPLYEEALTIRKAILGPRHPDVAISILNIAALLWAQGDFVNALQHLRGAAEIEEINTRSLLVYGDELRKRAYLATLVGSTYGIESFAVAAVAKIPEAVGLGLEILLQRKGRVLDVLADSLSRIRSSAIPEDQSLWSQYQVAQTAWATLSLRGPGSLPVDQYRARLVELERQIDDIATTVSLRSSQFRDVLESVTLTQVQQALPPQAVLLEWIQYRPLNPKAIQMEPRFGPPRYAVYVLKPQGAPVLVDLGEADALDGQVAKLLDAVRRPGDMQRGRHLAVDLYRRLLQPVEAHFGSAKQLLLSPDGQLNMLSFGVLRDTSGHHLADQYELTYLTSGRDLLRPAPPVEASRPSLLVADPSFDASSPAPRMTITAASTRRSTEMDGSGLRFLPLPGTAKEARDLGSLLNLAPSQVLTEARATETAVKQARSPGILHLATHGFFLPNLPETLPASSRGATLDVDQQLPPPSGENPLLRSGLALAGANQRQSGTDDGLLTALEVSSLDLSGTQLAVLSACQTAVGDVQNGEGVYGLRRALVLAGVRTQVVSLWQVDDAATQAFMGHFYRHVLNGMGRSAALRATQRTIRENPKWTHPYYWAAFVVIGESTPLPQFNATAAPSH